MKESSEKSCETQTIWTLFFGLTQLGHGAKLNIIFCSALTIDIACILCNPVYREQINTFVQCKEEAPVFPKNTGSLLLPGDERKHTPANVFPRVSHVTFRRDR